MKPVQLSAGRDSEWPNRSRQSLQDRQCAEVENQKSVRLKKLKKTELNEVEEGEDRISEEAGRRVGAAQLACGTLSSEKTQREGARTRSDTRVYHRLTHTNVRHSQKK